MTRTRPFLLALLYLALSLGAIPVHAAPLGRDALLALRKGDMRKLAIHKQHLELPYVGVIDMDQNDHLISEFKGKYVVLNFWATWCAPCRQEMPSLNALQKKLASDTFTVALVATNRNPKPAIKKFFKDEKIDALDTLLDPTSTLSTLVGIFALPVTLILDPEGNEIARMQGDANWNSPEAIAFLKAMIAGTDG